MPLTLGDFDDLPRVNSAGANGAGAKCSPWINVKRISDGQYFTCKALNYDWFTTKEKEILIAELTQIKNIKQNHILQCYDCIDNLATTTIFVFTEYCENGNLRNLTDRCRSDGSYLHGNFIWKVLYQILRALETIDLSKRCEFALYYHILLKHVYLDSKWNIKLGVVDLLLERYFCFQKYFCTLPWFISPEQINRKPCTIKSQVWSIGCIIYELCSLMPPFTAVNWNQMMAKFNNEIVQRIPWIYSDELHNIVCEMLTFKEDDRPSVGKLLSKSIFAPFSSKTKKAELCGSTMWDIVYQHKLKGINHKERKLVLKEQNLNERQVEIEESERKLSLKMKNLQDQLDRAEKIVGQISVNRAFASAPELNIVDCCPPPPLPMKKKKKVQFKLLEETEKENGSRSEFVAKRRQELERRLEKAQIKALSLRTEEIQSRHDDRIFTLPR